jgi:hypothetical protein
MRFALGATLAGLPLFFIKEQRSANAYVFLIILGFAVTNWQGLSRATAYLGKQLAPSAR